jgi:hypothetical protein
MRIFEGSSRVGNAIGRASQQRLVRIEQRVVNTGVSVLLICSRRVACIDISLRHLSLATEGISLRRLLEWLILTGGLLLTVLIGLTESRIGLSLHLLRLLCRLTLCATKL